MNIVYKTYRFRLFPSSTQENLLINTLGCCRLVYNYFLSKNTFKIQNKEKKDSFFDSCLELTQLKKNKEYIFLRKVSAYALQNSLKHLDFAFANYFSKKSSFPCFKSKKNKNSFTFFKAIRIEGNKIILPKFKEGILFKKHRPLLSDKIVKCTVIQTSSKKYFISIITKENIQPYEKTHQSCGIDLGIKTFAVFSDNFNYIPYKISNKYLHKIDNALKYLSLKQKNSKSFQQLKIKIAHFYEKITNSKNDYFNKLSNIIVKKYDVICIESLAIHELLKKRFISKEISFSSFYKFICKVQYKANWYGKNVIQIDRFFPSSKMCNICGYIKKDLTLSDRSWTCINGHRLDRDINASMNILTQGLKIHRQEMSITSI